MAMLGTKNVLNDLTDCIGTLAGNITSGDTTITLTSGQGSRFPTTNFPITILTGGVYEIVLISSRTGDVLTVATSGRGYDGSSASLHNQNDPVYHWIISKHITELQSVLSSIERCVYDSDYLAAAVQQIDIANLSDYDNFRLIFNYVNATATNPVNYGLYINGDMTVTHYYCVMSSNGNPATPVNNPYVASQTTAAVYGVGEVWFGNTRTASGEGGPKGVLMSTQGGAATPGLYAGTWEANFVGAITSVSVKASVASGIGVNSRVRLMALPLVKAI